MFHDFSICWSLWLLQASSNPARFMVSIFFFPLQFMAWSEESLFFFLFHFLLLPLQHNTSSIWVLTVTAIPWILRSCFYLYLCSLFPSRQNLPFSLCCVYFSLSVKSIQFFPNGKRLWFPLFLLSFWSEVKKKCWNLPFDLLQQRQILYRIKKDATSSMLIQTQALAEPDTACSFSSHRHNFRASTKQHYETRACLTRQFYQL